MLNFRVLCLASLVAISLSFAKMVDNNEISSRYAQIRREWTERFPSKYRINGGCSNDGGAVVSEQEGNAPNDIENSKESVQALAHVMSPAECLINLVVSDKTGLQRDDAAQRLSFYGPNTLAKPKEKSIWSLLLEQFQDRLVQILLGVAALSGFLSIMELGRHSFSLEVLTEPIVILSILTINALVGIWQSKSAEGSLEALYVTIFNSGFELLQLSYQFIERSCSLSLLACYAMET